MAEKRMFARKIIDSDAFLDMPLSSQALYFHLAIRADDDGIINNTKRITRTIDASEADFTELCEKGFLIAFDTGVVAVTHWRAHNTLKSDRYTRTQYRSEFAQLVLQPNKTYAKRNVNSQNENAEDADAGVYENDLGGTKPDPQERINQTKENQYSEAEDKDKAIYVNVIDLYNRNCTSFSKVQTLTNARIRAIDACMERFSLDDCLTVFRKAEASPFLKNHDGGWTVDFDWLMKTENFVKTLEGKYDDKKSCAQDRKVGALELQAIHNMNLQ